MAPVDVDSLDDYRARQSFAQHLTGVLGQLEEQERQLLDNSARRLAEE